MKKIAFFVVMLLLVMSFTIFAFSANTSAENESSNETSLTTADLETYATESIDTFGVSQNKRKKFDKENDFNLSKFSFDKKSYKNHFDMSESFINSLMHSNYYNTLDDYEVPFEYSYNDNTNYIEFTLDSVKTVTIYASSLSRKAKRLVCEEVESSEDDTYNVINTMYSSNNVKKYVSKFVFVLSKGTYHVSVENATAFIYGIYSFDGTYSQTDDTNNLGMVSYQNPFTNRTVNEEIDGTNVSLNATTTIQDVVDTNVVVNGTDKKLVYFIYELNNISDKSDVSVKYSGNIELNGKVLNTYENKDRELYDYLTIDGDVITSAQAKENTYYAFVSFRFNNSINYSGIEFNVTFTASIEGVSGNFEQTNSYKFNY